LVKLLYSRGYGALRLPSSGSGTDRPLPDLLIGTVGTDETKTPLIAAELKSGKDTTLYVDADERDALKAFCERFGARPYLVARYTDRTSPTDYFFVHPRDARLTDAGNLGLPKTDIQDRASWIVES